MSIICPQKNKFLPCKLLCFERNNFSVVSLTFVFSKHLGCRKNEIHCYRSTKGCFTMEQRCNGKVNCPQGEDEEGCDQTVCNERLGLFLCGDNMCMEEKYICDSSSDCVDGSDEMNCCKFSNLEMKSFHIFQSY